jgi:hypothetical protein
MNVSCSPDVTTLSMAFRVGAFDADNKPFFFVLILSSWMPTRLRTLNQVLNSSLQLEKKTPTYRWDEIVTFKSCVSRVTEAGNAIALATNDWQARKRNDSPRMGVLDKGMCFVVKKVQR